MKRKNIKKGFTLLELLVVVVIIGILAAIALPQYHRAIGKAELAQVISATKAIQNAQERFYLVNENYTDNMDNLDINLPNNNTICSFTRKYSVCYNKNYVIAHYFADADTTTSKNKIECYARDKTLITACEEFVQARAHLSENSPCHLMSGVETPCWLVNDVMPM